MKKILVTGPESSGKSFLAEELSKITQGAWVKEFARAYLNGKPIYKEEDLLKIAKGQKESESTEWSNKHSFVFSDTGIEVICIWSEVKYGRVDKRIVDLLDLKSYDHILLCKPNIPWQEDPLREHPQQRDYLFKRYKEFLQQHGVSYSIVDAPLKERAQQAIRLISLI